MYGIELSTQDVDFWVMFLQNRQDIALNNRIQFYFDISFVVQKI